MKRAIGILLLIAFQIMIGSILAYNAYVNSIYRLDRANAFLSRAETAGFAEDMIRYVEEARQLLPKEGNPVWWFPTARTDFGLIQSDIETIIKRAVILKDLPRGSEAYQQGMDDLRGKIRTLQLQIAEASGFMFASIPNLFTAALWLAALSSIVAAWKLLSKRQMPQHRS